MKPLFSNLLKRSEPDPWSSLPWEAPGVVFAVLDTETTGLNPARDRVLCIGALRIEEGRIRVRESLEIFIRQERFDHRSVPIHGIRKVETREQVPEKEALEHLLTYTKGAILVGHHIRFDLAILGTALSRHGLPGLDNPWLDTGVLYGKTLLKSPLVPKKESYTLDDLAHRYDLSLKDRHTALGDAYITALAFLHMLSQLKARKKYTVRQLLRMGS